MPRRIGTGAPLPRTIRGRLRSPMRARLFCAKPSRSGRNATASGWTAPAPARSAWGVGGLCAGEGALGGVGEPESGTREGFGSEFGGLARGFRFLMEQQFGTPTDSAEVQTMAEALYSFYWGARLVKLLNPGADTDAQLRTVYYLIERTLSARADGE